MVLVAAGIVGDGDCMPFIIVKANRIAAGKPMLLTQLLDQPSRHRCWPCCCATALCRPVSPQRRCCGLAIATLCLAALIC